MNYQDAVNRLEPLRYSQDLASLERTVADLDQALRPEGGEDYARFLLEASRLLNSVDWGDYKRQTRLMHEYADRALAQVPELSLETELQLLAALEDDLEEPSAAGAPQRWAVQRRTRAERWLRALRRLDDAAQRDFDFADVPQVNVAPPDATLPSGIAPEDIQDPATRQAYEAALEANRRRADTYASQWKLRGLHDLYAPRAERYIARAYARPPVAEGELEQLLERYVPDDDRRRTILRATQRERGTTPT